MVRRTREVWDLAPHCTITPPAHAGKAAAAALQQYSLSDADVRFRWHVSEPAASMISHEASLVLTVLATTDRRCSTASFMRILHHAGVDIQIDCAVSCCNHMTQHGRCSCMAKLPAAPEQRSEQPEQRSGRDSQRG